MSRTLVNRATTDDQKPVSGLLLKELADKTLESIIECQNIQTMLLSKLAKPSPDVKLKVLTCIKYLAQNGRDDFRIELQRNHAKIREHTTIRGVADPLRGELPFDKVRDVAKEAMNAIFNSTGRQEKSTANRMTGYGGGDAQSCEPSTASKMASMSSESSHKSADGRREHDYGSGTFSAGSMGQSGRTMQGYGNYDPTKDKTFLEKMKDKVVKEQPPGPYKPYVKPAVYGEASFGGYGGGVDIAPATSDATRKKFGVGGDWGKEDAPSSKISAPGGFGAAAQKSFGPTPTIGAVSQASAARNKNVQPTEFERKIIEEVTAPTGVRVTLSAGELAGFLRKCESLDTYMVVGLLNEKLADSNPHTQQKALHCLESLLSTERFAEDTEEFLSDHEETIASLLENPNKAIRTKALKIMVQIGLREPESERQSENPQSHYQPQQQQQQQQQQSAGSVDLLNLNAVETTTSSLQNFNFLDSNPSAQPASQSTGGFDFLQSTPAPAPAAGNNARPVVDAFNFTTSQPPANNQPADFNFTSSAPASNGSTGSASGFNFTSSAPASNGGFNFTSTTQAPTQPPSSNSFNFTSGAQPVPTSQSNGFNFMQESQPASQPSNNAGFNFASAPATSLTSTSSAAPLGFSFDPNTRASDFNFSSSSAPSPVFHFANSGPQKAATGAPTASSTPFSFVSSSAPQKAATGAPAASSAPFSFVSSSAPGKGSNDLQFLSDSTPSRPAALRDPVAELLLLGTKSTAPQFQSQSQFPGFSQQYPQQQQYQQQQQYPQQYQQQYQQYPQQYPPQQYPYPQQQQARAFPQLQPLQPLQPNRSTDNFFGVGMGQPQTPQKSSPRVDSFAFVKEEMSRN